MGSADAGSCRAAGMDRATPPATDANRDTRTLIMQTLNAFAKNESGAASATYVLIAALVALGLLTGAKNLGGQIKNTLNTATATMKKG
jgi:Flp pilus assembly pilin Flp